MNVLYIFGNGLDISLGMKTAYQDFYDYYKTVTTIDLDILHLKASIEEGRYQTWADLEAGLGEYSKNVDNQTAFLKCLTDIKSSLKDYLSKQFEQRTYQVSKRFWDDLFNPYVFLDERILNHFNIYRSRFPDNKHDFSIRIVTLNYTDTLEDIFTQLGFGTPDILHLHGSIGDGIVMGVSADTQIANIAFRKSRDIIEEFVKPSFNDACLNNNNSICEEWIKQADVIVLYGTSLGVTDNKWWQLIGELLVKEGYDKLIVYFAYDKDKDASQHPNYKLRWTEEYQRVLARKFFIPEDKLKTVLPRLCVGINKSIFQLKKKQTLSTPPKGLVRVE